MDNQPTEPPDRQPDRPRGGNGRFTRTLQTAERDAEAARLRGRGWSYRRIADEMGYASHTSVMEAVQRAFDAAPADAVPQARQLELERLDHLYETALKVLERRHVHVSGGNVVRVRVLDDNGAPIVVGHDDNGKPIYKEADLEDDGPTLKAVETLLKIQARRAALMGLDAPVKADVGVHQADPRDAELIEMINEALAADSTREGRKP